MYRYQQAGTYYRTLLLVGSNGKAETVLPTSQRLNHITHAAHELSINPHKFYNACICLQQFQIQSTRTFDLYLTSCRKLDLNMSKLTEFNQSMKYEFSREKPIWNLSDAECGLNHRAHGAHFRITRYLIDDIKLTARHNGYEELICIRLYRLQVYVAMIYKHDRRVPIDFDVNNVGLPIHAVTVNGSQLC